MKTQKVIKWLKKPETHNYPAAHSYLNLFYEKQIATELIEKLKATQLESFKAKDIFRAANVSLLGISNSHVEKDRKKIKKGIAISPILLIRDSKSCRVIIADGYHRLCAIYSFDEDAIIPCKIV
jgi:hypothetical protein